VFVNDDRRMAAMVSRSRDGALLVPSLIVRRVTAVRGSSRSKGCDKGGRKALQGMVDHLRRDTPALLAVDGPKGPRNHVHRGVVDLAVEADAPVLPVVVLPSRRWACRPRNQRALPKAPSPKALSIASEGYIGCGGSAFQNHNPYRRFKWRERRHHPSSRR
jgi:lysophospholipid acyltransferase (LPLAT)-like uncharacterized protein